MEQIYTVMYIVCALLMGTGLAFVSIALYNLIATKKAQKIEADIYDVCQEYTARGFIWKDRIKFEWNGQKRNYITKARSFSRGCGTLTIYVDGKGRVIEPKKCIENILIGTLAIIISLVILFI